MAIKSSILLAALMALSSQYAAIGATPVDLVERQITSDCPKRTFSLTAQATVGSLLGSTMYQVVVVPEDGGDSYVEITTCYLGGLIGAGCKWLTAGTAKIERPGGAWWTVEHSGYSAYTANSGDITMNGDDCDGQVQHCNSGIVQDCYPDPEGKTVTCIIDNIVACNQGEAPFVYAPQGQQSLASEDDLSATQKALLTS